MIDSQRAERVVALYFHVRIGVRGGATRLGTGFVPHPEQNPKPSLPFPPSGRGCGGSRLKY